MPSDPRSAPDTPDTDTDARTRAHSALNKAIVARPRPGSASRLPAELLVNLSLFTDALRDAGVPIEVGRGERPAHYGRPAAAERAHGAAPFGIGSRVKPAAGAPIPYNPKEGIPTFEEGEVQRVFRHGAGKETTGAWLADVQWDGGGVSEGLNCEWLELATESVAPATDASAVAAAVRKETGQGLVTVVVGGYRIDVEWHPDDEHAAIIQRALSIGDIPAPREGEWRWWQLRTEEGTVLDPAARCGLDFDGSATLFLDPAEGGGANRAERRVRAAHDLAADLAAGAGWKGTMPAAGTRRRRIYDVLLHEKVKLADGIAREPTLLDREGGVQVLADAIESSLLQATIDEEALARGGEALTAGIVAAVLPPTAQELLTAAQALPEADYRLLERALRWDVEDLATARRLDAEGVDDPEEFVGVAEDLGDGLSEKTGQRIARALETLTTSAGGALRELLDRTATDREAR